MKNAEKRVASGEGEELANYLPLNINEDNLKQGLLGLVVALVEIVAEVLRSQAFKRMESGHLREEEINRLGEALCDLELALEQIKEENCITNSVKAVHNGLNELVDDLLNRIINPGSWDEGIDHV